MHDVRHSGIYHVDRVKVVLQPKKTSVVNDFVIVFARWVFVCVCVGHAAVAVRCAPAKMPYWRSQHYTQCQSHSPILFTTIQISVCHVSFRCLSYSAFSICAECGPLFGVKCNRALDANAHGCGVDRSTVWSGVMWLTVSVIYICCRWEW